MVAIGYIENLGEAWSDSAAVQVRSERSRRCHSRRPAIAALEVVRWRSLTSAGRERDTVNYL